MLSRGWRPAGVPDKLSGVASYPGSSPHRLADSTLSISSPSTFKWNPISVTVTTAADGSFSYVTPEVPLAVSEVGFTVSSAATPYLEAGQPSRSLPVNQAAQVSLLTGTLTSKRVPQLLACGGIPEPQTDSSLVGPLKYQYSGTPHVAVEGTRHCRACQQWPVLD